MKTCLIYGHNGLDLDVAFNIRAFYSKIGYKAFISTKLTSATILVVLRAFDRPINLENRKYLQIHVFDYGGWEYDSFVKSLCYKNLYIFTTAPKTKQKLIDNLGFPKDQIYIAFPPVIAKLWVAKKQYSKINFEMVHIGNYKKIDSLDIYSKKFNDVIQKLNVDIWGLNWKLTLPEKYHGKAGLFEVSEIYSRSKYALGLMYPFQRQLTFSGRFWHAPLNGCYLFSEPGLYTKQIPGVIETNYTQDDILKSVKIYTDYSKLQKDAINFWDEQNQVLEAKLLILLQPIEKVKFSVKDIINYLIADKITYLRIFYQKYKIFKLWL